MRMWSLVACAVLATSLATRAADDVEMRGPVTRHTLWKVEGARNPVYLLGSIHVLRHQNYPLEGPIEDAFEQARVVAFEVDLEQAQAMLRPPPASPAAADQPSPPPKPKPNPRPPVSVGPEPRSVKGQLTPATHAALVDYLEGLGLSGTILDPLPPPLAAGLLVQLELHQLGFEPEWGIDAYFYRRARKYGKTVVPLETVGEQLHALENLSNGGSDALIAATLDSVATMRTGMRDLIRAWKGGELDRLWTLLNGSFHDRPEIYQRVILDRNLAWMPKIEALATGDVPALVVVGTGHLIGTDGIVEMLRAKGHTVTQL